MKCGTIKYYKVLAKCGHVKRNKYYEGTFYVRAKDGKAAAAFVRQIPRVKHDKKDAILSVEEITRPVYLKGKQEVQKEMYFKCHNSTQQRLYMDEIRKQIKDEPEKNDYKNNKDSKTTKDVFEGKNRIRNPKRFSKHYSNQRIEIIELMA